MQEFIKEIKAFFANRALVAAVSTLVCAALVDFGHLEPAMVEKYAGMLMGIIGIVYGGRAVVAVSARKKAQ